LERVGHLNRVSLDTPAQVRVRANARVRVRVRVGFRAGVRVRVCLDALGTERNLVVGLVRVRVRGEGRSRVTLVMAKGPVGPPLPLPLTCHHFDAVTYSPTPPIALPPPTPT